ncbi:uncharacterized protein LOC142330874 [Lycorma delicatula]|uniref:uncharacterized protein LOC142330874 n=1 Tax=Lycorma delicatula TaxID=130591 RepID=UPI003F517BF1
MTKVVNTIEGNELKTPLKPRGRRSRRAVNSAPYQRPTPFENLHSLSPIRTRGRSRKTVNSAPYQRPTPFENLHSLSPIRTRARPHKAAVTSTPNQTPQPVQNLASGSQLITSECAHTTVTSTPNQTPQPVQNLASGSQIINKSPTINYNNRNDTNSFMMQLSLQPVPRVNRSGYLYFNLEETSRTKDDFTNISLNVYVDEDEKRLIDNYRRDCNKDKMYFTTSNNSSRNAGQSEQTNTFYLCPKKLSNKSTNNEDDFIFKKPQIPPRRIIRKKKN